MSTLTESVAGSSIKRLARGTSINLFGIVFRIVAVFLHSLLAARLLGAEVYGVYAVGIANVTILSLVGEMGLARTLTRFVSLHWEKDQAAHVVATFKLVMGIAIPISTALGLFLVFRADLAALLFDNEALGRSFRVLGWAVPAVTAGALLAAFTQGFQRMRPKALSLDIVRPGVELLAMLLLVWIGLTQQGLALAYTIAAWASALLLIWFTRAYLRRLSVTKKEQTGVAGLSRLKPVLTFATPMLVVTVLMRISDRASLLMLGALGTTAMAGIFSILHGLIVTGMTFIMSINLMFAPMVSSLVERQEMQELAHLYRLTTRWIVGVSLPFFLILGFFGADILAFFGTDFIQGANALWYLVAAAVLNLMTGSCGIILIMSGHPHYSAINEAIMLAVVVLLNWFLIPSYGLLGAAWAYAVGIIVVNSLRLLQVWWLLRIHPVSLPFIKVLIAGTMMIGILWFSQSGLFEFGGSLYEIFVAGGLALLAYLGIILLLGLDSDEKELLRVISRRIIR